MPATTNFIQFNPTGANQEDDPTYAADLLRQNGAAAGNILGHNVANKLFYQLSTFSTAFCQMMVNKGYSTSDASLPALVSVLMNVKTSVDFPAAFQTVPSATSVSFDASQASEFLITLTGNVATSSIINASLGQQIKLFIAQDGVGGRTFSWPSGVLFPVLVNPEPNVVTEINLVVVQITPSLVAYAIGPGMWVNPSVGVRVLPNSGIVAVSASGNVSSQYAELTEKVNASAGPITRTLYDARPYGGFKVNIKKDPADSTSNPVTVQPFGSQTVDGFVNFQFSQPYSSFTFLSDGANWIMI